MVYSKIWKQYMSLVFVYMYNTEFHVSRCKIPQVMVMVDRQWVTFHWLDISCFC